jgi:hypothetical protein
MVTPTEEQKQLYADEGVYLAKGFLSQDLLRKARSCFDFVRANPSPRVATAYPGTDQEHFVDDSHPESWQAGIRGFVEEAGIANYVSELFDSEHVWYFLDEYFSKEGGRVSYTPWHQDHSVIPTKGEQWVNLWISFESLPARNSLGVIRGSHLGPLYNGASYMNPDDLTDPLYKDSEYERVPDIRADLECDPSSWEVATFDTEPGDVLFMHPFALHGAAPIDEQTPERHTMVLRFFGDDAAYSPLPKMHYDWSHLESQEAGAPFRAKQYHQLL